MKNWMSLFQMLSISAFCAITSNSVGTGWGSSEAIEINLPKPRLDSETSVEEALESRRSVRSFRISPLTVAEVSQLLWAAYGITEPAPTGPIFLRGGKRTAPSAGALYPLEVYLIAGDVNGLASGIYKYDSGRHCLTEIRKGDRRDEFSKAALDQRMIREAPLLIVYSAVFERTTKKYGNRGRERYVWMEVGHSAQNVYLQACALKLGACVSGAFSDSGVMDVVKMPEEEEPLYVIAVGRSK